MKQKLTFFNDLPIGAIAVCAERRFVKIGDAVPNMNVHDQAVNAVDLDTSHYLTFASYAECTLIKEPKDARSKYTLEAWISKITSL